MKIISGAKIRIILPNAPTERELFAAEELEKYLKLSLKPQFPLLLFLV